MAAPDPPLGRSRQRQLAALRTAALDEGLPLLVRARALIERMHLVDDILSEEIARLEREGTGG